MFVNARALIERVGGKGIELLIQTRNKPEEEKTCLELPGGRVEEFESLIDALRREVREETGLVLTEIEGLETKVDTCAENSNVECLQPFAVYQTTSGPVDSMGVYFRCKAQGKLFDIPFTRGNFRRVDAAGKINDITFYAYFDEKGGKV